ncbi:MAG TPA: CbiX/SirB N-terminal domain-containing protein [Bryobacteraceae bacterium]|nr:CbiX/SirB N-terminal domain-containing protein [Bryobacteraceae bacterium]
MSVFIVFAHGSSIESANDAVRAVAREAAKKGNWRAFSASFLESGRPSLAEAVENFVAAGEAHFIVVPYFLTAGLHLQRDLPQLISSIKRAHPNIELNVTAPLDGHPAMADALVDRAKQLECKPA